MFDIISTLKENSIEFKPVPGTDERIMSCPSCGRDDHFYYNIKKNLGMCQKCKWECNAVAFLMAALSMGRDAALALYYGCGDVSADGLRGRVRGLLERTSSESLDSHEVYFKNKLPDGLEEITRARFPAVFKEREVSYELAKWTGAKFCNSKGRYFNRIIVPVRTLGSETFTAVTALLKKDYKILKESYEKRGLKYRKSLFPTKSFMSEVLYLYNEYRNSKEPIFIIEGYWDVLKMIKLGYNSVGLLGNSISERQAFLISRMKAERIYLMLDGSVPEETIKKYHKLLSNLCIDKAVGACFLPNGQDPDESSAEEIDVTIRNHRKFLI